MESLLHECMNKTGYDQATVENVLNSLFEILEQKPEPGAKIDFGEYAETFVILRKGKKQAEGLLEILGAEAGCLYISDLHQPDQLIFVKRALYKIEPDRYSLREWNDAVSYITGQSLCFNNQSEAFKYLSEYTYEQI